MDILQKRNVIKLLDSKKYKDALNFLRSINNNDKDVLKSLGMIVGYEKAFLMLEKYYWEYNDFKKAVQLFIDTLGYQESLIYFEKLGQKGNVDACILCGQLYCGDYDHKSNIVFDIDKAYFWAKEAEKLDHEGSEFRMYLEMNYTDELLELGYDIW